MAIELHLVKPDDAPWGFRLTGGADFEVPFTIVKVIENSIAHQAGIEVGDVIVKINDNDVSDLSHAEANETIHQAGSDFVIGINRGQLTDEQIALITEEQSNEEVYNIMEGSIPIDYPEKPYIEEPEAPKEEPIEFVATVQAETTTFDNHELNLTDEEIHSIINPDIQIKSEEDEMSALVFNKKLKIDKMSIHNVSQDIADGQLEISELQARQDKINNKTSEVLLAVNQCLNDIELEGKKWSTFLQKPKGAKPKSHIEAAKVKSTYRVKIRTKKDLEAEKAAKKAEEEAIIAAELAAIEEEERRERLEREAKELAEYEAMEAALRKEERGDEEEEEVNGEDINNNNTEEDAGEIEEDPMSEISRSEEISKCSKSKEETILTLEQQLALVKEQLLELSEFPTTIQMTLGLITQQLQQIMKESQPPVDDENDRSYVETEDEVTELIVLESLEALSVVDEESENKDMEDHSQENVEVSESEILRNEEEEARRLEEEARRLEEEEARKTEEEKIKKKEKEREMSESPQHPLERPIILPGGRKWSQPDDATKSRRRNPKLSDDKIDETISSYYEVVTGHTIGLDIGIVSGRGRMLPIRFIGIVRKTLEIRRNTTAVLMRIVVVSLMMSFVRILCKKEVLFLHACDIFRESNCCLVPSTVTETKKINFLKYQPPPKNLDYLQKSDVYKMIHDMDEPPKGITARPEKILSEDEYYVKSNGTEESMLPPQMER